MGERYHPWRHAAALGIQVIHVELPARLWGYYDPVGRAVLNSRLCQYERRSTLAHEIVHHERGDTCRLSDRQEVDVRIVAARRLVTSPDLVEALLWTRDENELAERLWVDVRTIRIRLTDAMTDDEYTYLQRRLAAAERYSA